MGRGRFPQYMQVKQWVGMVTGVNGTPWAVMKTGDDKFYLFSQCLPLEQTGGAIVFTGFQNPVRKADLADPVRKALANGMSYDARIASAHQAV